MRLTRRGRSFWWRAATGLGRLRLRLGLILAMTGAARLAFAQEFQKVEGLPRQEVPAGPFVAAAYGFIWVAVLVYVLFVARGLTRVNQELGEISRKLGAKETPR